MAEADTVNLAEIDSHSTPEQWKGAVFKVLGRHWKKQEYIKDILLKLGLVEKDKNNQEVRLCIIDESGYEKAKDPVKELRESGGHILKDTWVKKIDVVRKWVDPSPGDYWERSSKNDPDDNDDEARKKKEEEEEEAKKREEEEARKRKEKEEKKKAKEEKKAKKRAEKKARKEAEEEEARKKAEEEEARKKAEEEE
ncbi:hypothetical protein FGADI_11259, partial [Fusarium gaditjirri]